MAYGHSDHPRPFRPALTALALALCVASCGESEPKGQGASAPAAPEAPAVLEISPEAPGVVYRYRDPETGEVASATDPQAIPAAARRTVVIYDPEVQPPTGADFVADLSKAPPWRAEAVAAFVFPPPPRTVPGDDRDARTQAIFLFSTEWCGYCAKARKFFKSRKVPFTEIDLETAPNARQRLEDLARKAGVRPDSLSGVPIIFIGDKPVLGWDEGQVKRLLDGG